MENLNTLIKNLFNNSSKNTFTKQAALKEVVEILNNNMELRQQNGKRFTLGVVKHIINL